MTLATVYDVAAYILKNQGELSAMKLQKLCYYSHAWHLVWEEEPLFNERIEAWANGPVVRPLYAAHRGQFIVSGMPEHLGATPDNLTPSEKSTIDAVLAHYGQMTAHQLSELTHRERPWMKAREGLGPGERGETAITDDQIAPYYDSLTRASTGG